MKKIIIIITILVVLVGAGLAYWYFIYKPNTNIIPANEINTQENGFNPLNRTPVSNTGNVNQTPTNTSETPNVTPVPVTKIPTLRMLSNTPVGGYGASTTPNIASTTKTLPVKGTTVVRWVDRGRGNIYEARGNTNEIVTISNTVLPRVNESVWNKNLTAFIGSMFTESTNLPTVIYAQLKTTASTTKTASSTTESNTTTRAPFELKGKNLPDKVLAYAVSPKGEGIFILINESGIGNGYIASFDGSSMTRIFTTPLLQLNVEWPEENTITITTKGSAYQSGFMYFVNPKTGVWKKILGPVSGLSTRTSRDAKYVMYSSGNTSKQEVNTYIYDVSKSKASDAMVNTLADKCVWGNFYKEIIYCAVPSQTVTATYPDDWYKGDMSSADKIWQINAITEEIHLVSTIVDQSDRIIDVFNLDIDARDNFLFFMNKRDLSLWSFDLVSSN
ncbi:MAG: hypothetical protein WC666_04490 [Candidatus Paceibacterota bacterium]|jgi:hypothetical protein